MANPTVKILVAYHKPAPLLKNDVLVPIHLGRTLGKEKSKDGTLSEIDYQWMLENMIGDDTGDNISHLNRYFNEMTGIYWAWKNYDKLGNPDYIGLMHYRRVFDIPPHIYQSQKNIQGFMENVDFICQTFSTFSFLNRYNSLKEYIDKCWKNLGIAMNILKEDKGYHEITEEFFQQDQMIFSNMFIMKRKDFFEYCNYIFPKLFKLHKQIKYNYKDLINIRACGYCAEYLTSIFLMKKMKENYKFKQYKMTMDIEKYLPKNNKTISVCFSSNDEYAPYLITAVNSLIQNARLTRNYEIYIIGKDLSEKYKSILVSMQTDNIKINYVDIEKTMEKLNISIKDFPINKYFSVETYYRFFIPYLFPNISKIIYLDTDIVINADVGELFDIDIDKNWFGVCRNVYGIYDLYNHKIIKQGMFLENYYRYICKIKDPRETLFQAGVMLFNVAELKKVSFLNICMKKLNEIGNQQYVEQDVLNSIAENKVRYIPLTWNHVWYIQNPEMLKNIVPNQFYKEYIEARKNPKIVHYAGAIKPWKDADKILADYFWNYVPSSIKKEIIKKNLPRLSVIIKEFFYSLFSQHHRQLYTEKLYQRKSIKAQEKRVK